MSKSAAIPSVDKISAQEFAEYLKRYESCVKAISDAKGAKAGQKTLAELDQHRYGDVLDKYSSGKSHAPMDLDEVKTLVEWKLRHGKFRPTLMKLVSSNEEAFVKKTIEKAIKGYRDNSDVSAAVNILTQLKGIGPATASLLLAVHDAENVIFFADEAFYWLCCSGSKGPIKYNLKEYAMLQERVKALTKRLGVKAVDVERVAFVLVRQGAESQPADNEGEQEETKVSAPTPSAKKQPAKRKTPSDDANGDIKTPLRRSKRGKQT